jgi:acyl carrier protein
MRHRIRQVLAVHGRLPFDAASLADDDNLYSVGMTSHASVNVMLALEEEFDVEFPDEMLTREAFDSISSIAESLTQLGADRERALEDG